MSHAQPQFLDLLPNALPAIQLPYRSPLTEMYRCENDPQQGEFGRLAEVTPFTQSVDVDLLSSYFVILR